MTERDVINIIQQAIYTGLTIITPILGLGLVMGLIVAIFQATTQINEQTLVYITKILAVVIAVLIFGSWILRTITGYTQNLYSSINTLLGL
jgi:flagellar biosynthetic protein FliQ